MMTKKDILENGLLEQYILGTLDPLMETDIEVLINEDTELQSLLKQMEADFETIGLENAIEPPSRIKAEILKSITNSGQSGLKPNKTYTLYIGIAASLAFLFMLGSFFLYQELDNTQEQLQIVNSEIENLQLELNEVSDSLSETNKWYLAISDPETEQYVVKGNSLLPDAKLISYVNHKTKSVVINTSKLPKIDDDHDYQMWADVDGEMINMGVIARDKEVMSMAYIDNAESLNVTIEPLGGNDHPTVSRLIGNVYLN
ncbi:MAG: anti-sigma factor [Bacteroidia bacterium]|nr:anti-sigma factor [Bacteroidia bacterium]